MSAYMVDKDHIDYMIQSAIAGATDSRGWERPTDRGFSYWLPGERRRVTLDPFADEVTTRESCGVTLETIPPGELGERLIRTNLDSIHARYPDTVAEPEGTPGPLAQHWEMPYAFEPIDTGRKVYSLAAGLQIALQPIENTASVAAQLGHYEYQSCEHDSWHESEGFAFCRAMRERLLARLPGAGETSWGFKRQGAVA